MGWVKVVVARSFWSAKDELKKPMQSTDCGSWGEEEGWWCLPGVERTGPMRHYCIWSAWASSIHASILRTVV